MEKGKFFAKQKIRKIKKMEGELMKEIIITIVIATLVIVGNIITQNNTNRTVAIISEQINTLRDEITKEKVDKAEAVRKGNEVDRTWQKEYEKMAYYIEHDELEKVETELVKLKADIEVEEYEAAVENLDNCVFLLKHIKDKTALKIVNIF